LPKPIVHGHGGITLELLKLSHFHFNLKPGSVMFFYSTTGWVMWNIVVASLLSGAAAVLYDGNPAHPDPDVLWRMAADTGTTFFGASPAYVSLMQKNGVKPGNTYDLSRLEGILLGGSPVTPEAMHWCYENIKADLWVTSQSGGTDVSSGFVGASPTLPVYAGEIQTAMLGVDVQAWNDAGEPVVGEVGELVVTQPMPSMPLCFWNDRDNRRYRESYFEVFPGTWRHGDYLKINSRGGCYIYGRSDSTLNRFGVRIGTAEIYRAVEAVEGVEDSLIVCLDLSGGRFSGRGLDGAHRRAPAPRIFAAPHSGPHLCRRHDSLHSHRQEDGGPGAQTAAGNGAGKGCQSGCDGQAGGARLLRSLRSGGSGLCSLTCWRCDQ
jgi:acetoacetyl-CoA synthetase